MTGAAPTTGPGTRRCVVIDVGDGSLLADLIRLEELLLTLRRWEQDAAGPDGDGWTPPGVLAGDRPAATVGRLYRVLRPTQTRTEHGPGVGQRREVAPGGPRWYAADGRYELAAVSFVDVDVADVELLAAVAAELGRPGGDPDVAEAIAEQERDLPHTHDTRQRERRGLVVTAARIAGLLDLEPATGPTPDAELLHTAQADAGEDAEHVVLTVEQEQAYHRVVDRFTALATLSDPLTRWAMGTIRHHD